ncbi:hypothetical protein [uncultured Ruegeria sp.]|uniref:hypothetical protein n=1 Tax=uncultured Ruegeria sp. TaxID=259304 RepID=UPI0026086277|nr:hypothetical protein [uncultured Ruegeria sp.]
MPPDPTTKLPPSVQEIADVIGREKALEFIGKLPNSGSRSWRVCIYIPKDLPADHKLVELLGWHDARRMVDAFSGMILQPSNCRFLEWQFLHREIVRLHREGVQIADIADMVERTAYWVRVIIARAEETQPKETVSDQKNHRRGAINQPFGGLNETYP